ncbi:MAG TPA: class III poly(R)-hydroxyalkanoic acid synthase subunit PhaC [Syntrophales bacterium]|nr:class III poly(R)-hydroxyalkanoic acid synthase subunit PhaC [Syntrophales bacterium]HPI55819.1 class III poly(R)-hydroxyalkanoic acid synthase subunit PhaC [Syntrophales bacterium]HPN23690.1 class III poly(R)-hydroxyalkanoic acid synthase subunit PhaC [Syntrophales bacterium]HQM27785.1 class III poly(R)-hydroxyalkanoic acid synthase subunit PhaC [Syntrophales bacterium]
MAENVMETIMKENARVQQKLLKGFENMVHIKDLEDGVTPREVVYKEDKVEVYHFKPEGESVCPVPLLICYALVNRQYMMDIQDNLSLFRKLIGQGLDLYVIDWGYPSKMDKYQTMEDYIDGYLNNAVDFIRETTGSEKINLLGVCQGGAFSTIYAALYPEKIQNLVVMVAPIDLDTQDGLLQVWSKSFDVELMVDTIGNVPGEFLNLGFLWLKPFQLVIDKYIGLIDKLDNPEMVKYFLRMEKWIFDSPDQAGETFKKFVKDLFQQNLLCKGEFTLGGRKVDLKKITMPVLNLFGEQDHLVPPYCSKPLAELVGTKDVTTIEYPVGHIGMYVSSKAQKEMPPTVANWLKDRCSAERLKGPGKEK